jgi:peptidoglycan/LPS O-acetylase OafA/YrhL
LRQTVNLWRRDLRSSSKKIELAGAVLIPRRERLIGIDLLRAVAIIQVIAVHLSNGFVVATAPIPATIVGHWNDGVTLFFVISGFLITRTIMQRERDIHRLSLRAFYVRRIARVQPLLLAAIALGAIMLAFGFSSEPFLATPHAAFDATFWLSLVTFSFNWVRVAAMQHGIGQWGQHWDVMWSLAVEEQFYLLLPAALILSRSRARFLKLLAVVIGICAIGRLIGPHYLVAWDFSSFAGFDALGVGVLIALIAPYLKRSHALCFMLAGLAVLILGALSASDDAWRPLVMIVGAALFVLGAQALDHIFGAPWRFPARIGELSYELYLLHPLVLTILAPVFREAGLSFEPALLLSLVVAVGVAQGVEIGFTRPMNIFLRRALLAPRRVVKPAEA